MKQLKSITIKGFKAFKEPITLELGGKHALIYGENGTGKSSIYWALYTILQSSIKDDDKEVDKYFVDFDPGDQGTHQSLVNRDSQASETEIKIQIQKSNPDPNPEEFHIKYGDRNTKGNELPVFNQTSDFINYKLLQNFSMASNRYEINLWRVFERDIFPFVDSVESSGKNLMRYILEKTNDVPRKRNGHREGRKPRRDLEELLDNLNDEIDNLVNRLQDTANDYLRDYFFNGEKVYKVNLSYVGQFNYNLVSERIWNNEATRLDNLKIELKASKWSENLKGWEEITRPHTFLNEANMTKIAFSIRLAALVEHPKLLDTGILVLDDILVSLDMSNREEVVNFLLDDKSEFKKFNQIIFITHDIEFYKFLIYKISQKDKPNNWVFKELYLEKNEDGSEGKPFIIDGNQTNLQKARGYFNKGDYTATSIYLRKELEKVVIERLPVEYTRVIEGKPHNLKHLWTLLESRYQSFGSPITEEIKVKFEQSKLLILNPQAHYSLGIPVYRNELESIFSLVGDIEAYPIPRTKILLNKGMQFEFKHPAVDYSFCFELASDFTLDGLGEDEGIILPKCKVLVFQFESNEYWNFRSKSRYDNSTIDSIKGRSDRLDKVYQNIKKEPSLNLTQKMFIDNTSAINGIWSLRQVVDEVELQINLEVEA